MATNMVTRRHPRQDETREEVIRHMIVQKGNRNHQSNSGERDHKLMAQQLLELYEKLAYHDAMKSNLPEPFTAPPVDKNRVYFMWTWYHDTLVNLFRIISKKVNKVQVSASSSANAWASVKQRALGATFYIVNVEPGVLDSMLHRKYGYALPSHPPEFGDEIVALAMKIRRTWSQDITPLEGLLGAAIEVERLDLHYTPNAPEYQRHAELNPPELLGHGGGLGSSEFLSYHEPTSLCLKIFACAVLFTVFGFLFYMATPTTPKSTDNYNKYS